MSGRGEGSRLGVWERGVLRRGFGAGEVRGRSKNDE